MLRIIAAAVFALAAIGAARADQGLGLGLRPQLAQTYRCRDYNSLVRCTQSCRTQLDRCYDRAGINGALQNQCKSFHSQCVNRCFSYYCK